MIKEFHLFAGIGGGIYGGKILKHICCGGVEINKYCQDVIRQRQKDGWMDKFPLYDDITNLSGNKFVGKFDVLCGGFPCQAFSHAAHGKNIADKDLWAEMYRFVLETNAPVVFAENVTLKAIEKAKIDLEHSGYIVERCKLSCGNIGADHRRDRFWLLAVKDSKTFNKIEKHIDSLPKFHFAYWTRPINENGLVVKISNRREQLKAIGNAQAPLAAATAFRILVNRHKYGKFHQVNVDREELNLVIELTQTWIRNTYGKNFGYVHTPTTMANYSAPSMMKHLGCRNFKKVFDIPAPDNAEYLMGFPLGASSLQPMNKENIKRWAE